MERNFWPDQLAHLRALMAAPTEPRTGPPADCHHVPGVVTLLSRRGETHVDAAGVQSIGGPPMRADTIFRIASLTKPITAVAALILIEECRLRLDDAIDEWLPELADRQVLRQPDSPLSDTVPAERPITVRDLLTFRSGFGLLMRAPDSTPIQRALSERDLGQSGPPQPSSLPGPDEWLRRLGELPLLHQPGQQWMYNTASDILGVLIGRCADQPFADFLIERIFAPLGMDDTGFFVPPSQIHRLATQYSPHADGLIVYDEPRGGQWSAPPPFASGAGGLASTVTDYAVFARMLLDGGQYPGCRLLSRPTVELMVTDQLTSAQKRASTFPDDFFASHGWGFGVSTSTRRTDPFGPVGSYGWSGGLGTAWNNDPSNDVIAMVFTQLAWTSPVRPTIIGDFFTAAYAAVQ